MKEFFFAKKFFLTTFYLFDIKVKKSFLQRSTKDSLLLVLIVRTISQCIELLVCNIAHYVTLYTIV